MTVPDKLERDVLVPLLNKWLLSLKEKYESLCSFAGVDEEGVKIGRQDNGPCHASLKYWEGARYVLNVNPNPEAYSRYVHYIVYDSPYREAFRPDLQTFDEMMKVGFILDGAAVSARILAGACIALRMVYEYKSICEWFEKHTELKDSAEYKNLAFILAHMLYQTARLNYMSNSHQAISAGFCIRAVKQFVFAGEIYKKPPYMRQPNYQNGYWNALFKTFGEESPPSYAKDVTIRRAESLHSSWSKDKWSYGMGYFADTYQMSVEDMRSFISSEVEWLRGVDTTSYISPPAPPKPNTQTQPLDNGFKVRAPWWLSMNDRNIRSWTARVAYDEVFGNDTNKDIPTYQECLRVLRAYYRQLAVKGDVIDRF